MNNSLRKIFTSFVSLTTIAWSVGLGTFALPTAASAATLMAGDLIKASGPAVYYYGSDQKRYVFPNEKTYLSWHADFSGVKTITDAELAAVQIGGNVTIRPGTKLIKITTDPKTYAVTKGGVLHWIESEAVATALYGSNWAKMIVDVPDGFFVNYSVGSSVSSAVHPDGTLVKYANSTQTYVVEGGQKRAVSTDAFTANRWNSANVLTTTISYPDGTAVAGLEAGYAYDVAAAGGAGGTTGGTSGTVGGSVSVALASDTPAGVSVPKNSASVQMVKINLTAGSADAVVTGLRFHRVGVGSTSDFSNVYLYDGSGTRLTTGRSVNSQTNYAEFNSVSLAIPAGTTKAIILQGDFGASSSGGQHSFELADAASIVISGTGTVSGSFPVRGNVFTVGNANAARVDIQIGTTPSNPNIGAEAAEISNFKIGANTNDVELRRITLLQAGSITNTDLADLKLYQGATPVATTAALANDKIVLTFSPPFLLQNGTTRTFSLRAKVGGRAGRTIRTYVEYTTDVYAVDKIYNSGAAICISASQVGGCTATNQGSFDGATSSYYIQITTQGGQLTVVSNGPATSNVAKGSQDVVLHKFALTSSDNDLEIRNLRFKLQGTTALSSVYDGTNTFFSDIKIKNLDTNQTLMGPTSISTSGTSATFTLSDSFILKAGQTMNLAVTSDLGNSSNTGFVDRGYQVILGVAESTIFGSNDVRIVNTGEYLDTAKIVPNSAITGNTMTVKASSLSVSLASDPSSNTVVKKQSLVPAVGFVFTAGAQSDILVTAMKLTGSATTTDSSGGAYLAASLDDVVTGCGLYDGNNKVGLSQAPGTDGTVNITNMNVPIPKGTSKILVAKCTLDSVVGATTNGDKFALGIATAATDVTAQDGDNNTVTASLSSGVTNNAGTVVASLSVKQTVRNSGTLTVATDSLRQPTILVAGSDVWQNFAQFKATAQYENIKIERLMVTSTGDAAHFSAVAIAQDGAVKGWDILPSGKYSAKDIDLSANSITVPKGASATFQVWGKLATVQASSTVAGSSNGVARSGGTVALGLAADYQTGEWSSSYDNQYDIRTVGDASGERVYATSTTDSTGTVGNTFVIRKSKPTVTRQALSTTTLTSGADMDLYKFQVAADSAGSVSLKKVTFNISFSTGTNSTLNLTNFRLRRGSTDLAASAVRIFSHNNALGDLQSDATGLTSGASASGTARVAVTFVSEETVAGSGNVYTLHATVGGNIVSGDSVNVALRRTGGSTVVTGYLTGNYVTSTTANIPGPQIDTATAPAGTEGAVGTFVWADQSEAPHSDATGANSGSRDWSDDVYVEDVTQSQSLSR